MKVGGLKASRGFQGGLRRVSMRLQGEGDFKRGLKGASEGFQGLEKA